MTRLPLSYQFGLFGVQVCGQCGRMRQPESLHCDPVDHAAAEVSREFLGFYDRFGIVRTLPHTAPASIHFDKIDNEGAAADIAKVQPRETRINDGAVFRDAGLFIESTLSQARVIISADQFIVTAPGYEKQPFVFIGGVAALQVANIGTVTAGVLQSPDGKVKFELANKRLTFSD